jgi:hypothetical protein
MGAQPIMPEMFSGDQEKFVGVLGQFEFSIPNEGVILSLRRIPRAADMHDAVLAMR